MTPELENLFRFQLLITEMQQVVVSARRRGEKPEVVTQMVARIDKLIEIYKTFDKYYYAAHFAKQKILSLEFENQAIRGELLKMKDENEKLLKSIQWK